MRESACERVDDDDHCYAMRKFRENLAGFCMFLHLLVYIYSVNSTLLEKFLMNQILVRNGATLTCGVTWLKVESPHW